MNAINFEINLKNNNLLLKEKVKKQNKQLKNKITQASSLEALSCYAKAEINFMGKTKPRELEEFENILRYGKDENGNDLFPQKNLIEGIISGISRKQLDIARWLFLSEKNKAKGKTTANDVSMDDGCANSIENIEFTKKLCYGKDEEGNELFPRKELIEEIILNTNDKNRKLALDLCFKKNESGKDVIINKAAIADILRFVDEDNVDFALELCSGKDKNGNDLFPQKELIGYIILAINDNNIEFAKKLCFGKDEEGNDLFPQKKAIKSILDYTKENEIEITKQLCFGKDKNGNEIFPDKPIISFVMKKIRDKNIYNPQLYIDKLKNCEINQNMMILTLERDDVSFNEIRKLKSVLNMDLLSSLSTEDLYVAIKMVDVARKKDIDEINKTKRKTFIRNLMSFNIMLYGVDEKLKSEFPLLPTNNDEYCSLMQKLSKSVGVEANDLTQGQINLFGRDIKKLAKFLSDISDGDFNTLEINQEYSRDDFIKNVFEIIKDLTLKQQQKACDYFGFELKRNKYGVQVDKNPKNSFSIVGYPLNLKNKENSTDIDDVKVKTAIEKLKPEVERFCKDNAVICSNKKIKSAIDEILNLCPQLRTQIGKTLDKTHDFDTFKHSLKTMQKVAQNPEFVKMNESDKKVLLVASLLHDCNKSEGYQDTLHPKESAFDSFYIAKNLGFNNEEISKLHSLINTHEWLSYTNNKNEETYELEKRLKLVAYDVYQDNLFEMAKILTEADLKAVKENDDYYDKFEILFKANSTEIDKYVFELKSTQPLLPITKIPNATRIKEAIKAVNFDGSTNLKGVYQDKSGMVIIKFNEVENETWEKIGFVKKSISKGIDVTDYCMQYGAKIKKNISTGNIKFLAHGLDHSGEIRNFDAFGLVDSDALLSVSYMERPESKYRLFRHQGVLLDVDAKNIHGGGNTDSGSGCKKNLDFFKGAYAFSESYRYSDRIFISELIKEALELNDEEYIEFVKNNKNKTISEIEPKEYQDAIIKCFASINSSKRIGEREYNEMYVTNPKISGVFAYSETDNVGNVMEFVENQKDFLKKYALDENLPFIVFGD